MQVLHASRAAQAALGYHLQHGPGGLVHYSTAPAVAAVSPDSSTGFCLSREKVTLQQLNKRLAAYLQQVQCLEAANQKLETQIQMELDRKCPSELRKLDGHLRTVSLLQEQISDCLSAQAQIKLQLLSAELTVFDLNVRCEKEREHCGCLEVDLSNLRVLEEELQVHKLPELHSLLNDQTQQLMGLHVQHQQDMQGLMAQMSGGVSVEMHPVASSDLIQQLDYLRQTSLLDENQNDCWFDTQVSTLSSPEMTFEPPAGSKVVQAELDGLRGRAASLEEELNKLQAQNMVLEASGLEQNEYFVQQLVVLQQRVDSLCGDLDSVLQAAAQQAADYESLLDIKIRLEAEIQDYMRLLDGLSPQGVPSLRPNSAANVAFFCVTTSPSSFRKNITVNKTASVQGGNLRMMDVQGVTSHIHRFGQTPVVAPLSETVTTFQSTRDHNKYPKNSPVTSINASNLTGSFHMPENQRTGAHPERTGRESMTINATINRQSIPVVDKVYPDHYDLQIVSTQISQGSDKGTVKKTPKPETGLQANKTETNIQTEITETIVCTEPEVNRDSHSVTHTNTTNPSTQTAAEIKKETETVVSITCTKGFFQTKNQDPAQVVSLSLQTQAEADEDAEEVAVTVSVVSGSHILSSQVAHGKVSGDVTLMDDKNIERQIEEVEGTSGVLRLDQSLELSDVYNSEKNKVMEDVDTGSSIAAASSRSPDSSDILESETAQGITTVVPDTQSTRSDAIQATPETFTSKQTITEVDLHANETATNIQTEITKTILWTEPEVKQGPCTTTTDPSKQTAAEVLKETENEISAQMNCTQDLEQAKNQDPAQVVSLSLETQAEIVGDSREVAVTVSVFSGSHIPRCEEAQGKVSGDMTLMDDKNIERQEKKGEKEVLEVEGTLSGSPDSNDILDPKTVSTVILKEVELEVNKGKVVNSFHVSSEEKVDPIESDNEMIKLAGEETLESTTEHKRSTNLTDSSVTSSNSSIEAHKLVSPTKPVACLSPEICLSPVETEVLMSMTDQVFRPVDPKEDVGSPHLLLSPNDHEMFLNPNDSDTCLSPVEDKMCLSPNGEEENEEVCQSLTEANIHVRPVEKYILSTKEEGQSLSFNRDDTLREEDRNIPARDGDSLCFGSFEGNKGSRAVGGIADKRDVQNQGVSPEGRCNSEDKKDLSDKRKSMSGSMATRNSGMASNLAASSGGKVVTSAGILSCNAEVAVTAGAQGRFRRNSGDWMVYGGSLGCKSSLDGSTSIATEGKEQGPSVATSPATSSQTKQTGRFGSSGSGSGEWMVYSGSKNSLHRTRSEESPSAAILPATCLPMATHLPTSPPGSLGAGKPGSRGSGEWRVYGGRSTGRISSWISSSSLPNAAGEELPSVAMQLATSPPQSQGSGKFGSGRSGEWRVYSGNTERMSSWAGSNSLSNREEIPSVAAQLPTSPPGSQRAGRFGSAGSGEWRVYGGSTGRLSSASSADRVNVSVSRNQIISPPSSHTSSGPGGRRLSSGSVVRRSSSVGSGCKLSSSGSCGKLSSSSESHRSSTSGRFTSTGSVEGKPVYSSANARRSNSQRAPSPGGRMGVSMGSGGWLSSSPGSGSKVSSGGSSDKISSRAGGRISSSSGSGRTNSTGGRVISSSDQPIRSTGSGAGGNKERISVCKMAALSISAAGREKSRDRQKEAQRPQQQQQAKASSPLLQRWLSTGGVSSNPDGLDDMRL